MKHDGLIAAPVIIILVLVVLFLLLVLLVLLVFLVVLGFVNSAPNGPPQSQRAVNRFLVLTVDVVVVVTWSSLWFTLCPIKLIYHLPFIIQNHFKTFKWIQTVLVDLKETKKFIIFQHLP